MSGPAPVLEAHAAGDFYVPHFEVFIGGRRQTTDVVRDVTQVTFKDDLGAIDSFELAVNNWDADARRFKYSEDHLFDPGQTVELWMGYYGADNLRLMLTGEITGLRPTFPAGGAPSLTVTGLNVLHRFRKEQVTRAYTKLTASAIARQVADRLGVDVKTRPADEPVLDYVLQNNVYDILFLLRLARETGYVLYVVPVKPGERPPPRPVLYFGPPEDDHRTTFELRYGRSLIQFQPNLTTANQVWEVTVVGWDAVNKKKIEAKADRSQLGAGKAGFEPAEESFKQRREVITTPPVTSQAEAEKRAKAELAANARDMIKGSGSTVGLPDLRAGERVRLFGLGARFSGRYALTGTTHTIGAGGYTTAFECDLEETLADPEAGR